MPIFKIKRKQIEYFYGFIDAETEEEATEIAMDIENDQLQNGSFESDDTILADFPKDELQGMRIYINDGDSYKYGDSKEESTPVLFLIEKESNGVFAYFPEMAHSLGNRTSYAHVGQHSACSPEYAKECKEAVQDQYRDLLTELTVIGYTDLKVLNKDWTN